MTMEGEEKEEGWLSLALRALVAALAFWAGWNLCERQKQCLEILERMEGRSCREPGQAGGQEPPEEPPGGARNPQDEPPPVGGDGAAPLLGDDVGGAARGALERNPVEVPVLCEALDLGRDGVQRVVVDERGVAEAAKQ